MKEDRLRITALQLLNHVTNMQLVGERLLDLDSYRDMAARTALAQEQDSTIVAARLGWIDAHYLLIASNLVERYARQLLRMHDRKSHTNIQAFVDFAKSYLTQTLRDMLEHEDAYLVGKGKRQREVKAAWYMVSYGPAGDDTVISVFGNAVSVRKLITLASGMRQSVVAMQIDGTTPHSSDMPDSESGIPQ